ncbi:hypothetical protein [Phenylobacterium sp.]|uniref:hypothetical protein n=1 Tax=Phenylobacterium sp. TaxID=1871053 RepID=UPI0035B46E6F
MRVDSEAGRSGARGITPVGAGRLLAVALNFAIWAGLIFAISYGLTALRIG